MANFTTTGSDTFPTGLCIQCVTTFALMPNHVTMTQSNTFTLLEGIHQLAITPKVATSNLSILATIHPYGSGGSLTCAYDIYDTRTSDYLGNDDWGSVSLATADGYGPGGQQVYASTSAGTTAARTYKVASRNATASRTLYNHGGTAVCVTIWEMSG